MPFDAPREKKTPRLATILRSLANEVEQNTLKRRYDQDDGTRCTMPYFAKIGTNCDETIVLMGRLPVVTQQAIIRLPATNGSGQRLTNDDSPHMRLFGNNLPGERRTRAQQVELLRKAADLIDA